MQTTVYLDVVAEVHGRAERCDYGVPRSPVWVEVHDASIAGPINVAGVEIPKDHILHGPLSKIILEQANDLPPDEWDDPD